MRTFHALLRSASARRGRTAHTPHRARNGARPGRHRRLAQLTGKGASESGLSLIEVLISALLLGMIVIATYTGFDTATRAATNQRQRNQATLLAAQDEERLRGAELTKLTQVGHETNTVSETGISCSVSTTACSSGTKYTIESFAEYVSGGEKEDVLACGSSGTAEFIKSTSIVSWWEYNRNPAVKKTIKQSSVVAVPSSTTVEVKAVNQAKAPVSGATVTVKGSTANLSQTTLGNGCVVFGSVGDKSVEVDATKTGWVGANGSAPSPISVNLSSTATTVTEFTLAEPGTLNTEFVSNGGAVTGLTGDTVYVAQNKVGTPPNFIAGTAGSYHTAVSFGGLFPFVSPNTYTVYAGDCEKNNPEAVVGSSVSDAKAQIEPGGTTSVKVEEPQVNLLVKSGTSASEPGAPIAKAPAKLINKECQSTSAQNYTTVPYERAIEVVAGRLAPRYAPYAKSLELCVAWGPESGKYYKNKTTFANAIKAGSTETTFYAKGSGVTSSTIALTC